MSAMISRTWIFAALLGTVSLAMGGADSAAEVVSSAEATRTIVINDLIVKDASVSGVVVNKSDATVREVELLLRQTWLWHDERHPGTESPGRALPFLLSGDIAPHSGTPCVFQMAPLAERSDGRIVTTMDVTGFSEVGP